MLTLNQEEAVTEHGILVGLAIDPKLKADRRARLFRQLYGWRDKSQFGKYERKGLLANEPLVRLMRGVFIVRKQDKKKVIDFLKDKARNCAASGSFNRLGQKTAFPG